MRLISRTHVLWGICLLALIVGNPMVGAHTVAIDYDDWQLEHELTFDDRRDLDGLNTSHIWPRETIINDEQQYYVDPEEHGIDPFRIDDGILSIVAAPTPEDRLDDVLRQPFTSGILTSRTNGHSQLYGLWEIRAKLPDARGAWPAFWLLPTHDQWPRGVSILSEIDVVEGVGGVGDGFYHVAMHSSATGEMITMEKTVETRTDLTESFHTYAVKWDVNHITYYFDGREVYRVETPTDMHRPRHYLLNLAVGGFAGRPALDDYPTALEVDYVRVYSSRKVTEEPSEVPLTYESLVRILNYLRDIARGGADG